MPLKQFKCSICGASAPKKYLKHGQFKNRMDWLRRHYASKHKKEFRKWGK